MKYVLLLSFCWLVLAARPTCAQQPALYFPPTAPGAAWATTTPQSLGWCQPQLDSLLGFLGRKHTRAFLILKDGRLVVERYYGTYTADSAWYWASAGKSLTATLVGIAQQEGLLSIQDSTARTLGRVWSVVPAAKERLIRVRHQLSMTTGLNDALRPTPQVPDPDNCLLPPCLQYRADAGTRWAYHNAPYRLLQDVVARASGISFQQYTTTRLASRIGMRGIWNDYVFYSRARDMARFGLLIQARGSWNGTPVLTDTAYFRQMTTPSQALNPSYGYLWWLNGQGRFLAPSQPGFVNTDLIPTAPRDLIAAMGKNDQRIYVVPSLGLVVVRQGESAGVPGQAITTFDPELWRYLMAAVQCRPLAASTAAVQNTAQLYPNPATHVVTATAVPGTHTLALLDGTGRPVRQQPAANGETTISLAGLPAGLYLLQWLAPEGRVLAVRRLVVSW